jgi:hypothetical protein
MRAVPLLVLSALLLLTQCVIRRGVTPAGLPSYVKEVAVLQSSQTVLQLEVVEQLCRMGYEVRLVEAPPLDGSLYLTSQGKMHGDSLDFFRAELFQDSDSLGAAQYDASKAMLHPGKGKDWRKKIRPLLEQLMGKRG